MTDRDALLRRLDELVATAKTLDDDGLAAVVGYLRDAVTAATPEPMPDDVAAAVEREVTLPGRLQQIADAPGGRIVLDVGDLTDEELELIADSEIPPELRWNSDDEPDETP